MNASARSGNPLRQNDPERAEESGSNAGMISDQGSVPGTWQRKTDKQAVPDSCRTVRIYDSGGVFIGLFREEESGLFKPYKMLYD